MAITTQQREARRKCVGSSDVAAIMLCDPYRSLATLWLEKTGRAEDFEGNEATRRGVRMEGPIIDYAEEELGVPLTRNVSIQHAQHSEIAANLDAQTPTLEPVEAKSSQMLDEWGDDESDAGVPKRAIVQVNFQIEVVRSQGGAQPEMGYVPRILPRHGYWDSMIHRVPYDAELCEMMMEASLDFMRNYVQKDIRPDDWRPSLEVIKRIKRIPAKVIELDDAAMRARIKLDRMKAGAKKVNSMVEEAQAVLLSMLGDAEAGILPDGREITYMLQERAGYSVKPTSFRQMKISKHPVRRQIT